MYLALKAGVDGDHQAWDLLRGDTLREVYDLAHIIVLVIKLLQLRLELKRTTDCHGESL